MKINKDDNIHKQRIISRVTDRLTVKVNHLLDAKDNGKFNFDTIIHKNFKNQTLNQQRYAEICKKIKKKVLVLSSVNTKIL